MGSQRGSAERAAAHLQPYRPFLEIRGSRLDDVVLVEARNVELSQLVQEFAAHFQVPMEVEVELTGTMSAQLRGANAAATLHSILQSAGMGIEIRDDKVWHVVRMPFETTRKLAGGGTEIGTPPSPGHVRRRSMSRRRLPPSRL